MLAAGGQGLLQLGAIRTLAGLDLSELGDEFPGAAVEVGHDGRPLGVEAEAGLALLVGGYPVIGDELTEMCGQCCSPRRFVSGCSLWRHREAICIDRGLRLVGRVAEIKMLNKTEQSDRALNPNEKPEDCYCSALPKGSGLCLPCYARWLGGERPRPDK